MWRHALIFIALTNMLLAVYMWFAPMVWYESTPGVAPMGPFNLHFIRDVALTYLVSGAALGYGAYKGNQAFMLVGAAWPACHALYHIAIWFHRGLQFDTILIVNVAGIQLPAWIALIGAIKASQTKT